MADLLNIGLSGLAASKTQLTITGHNITNVNTPGYTRQDAMQATRLAQFSGAGYIGAGTTLVDVRRSYSEFLTQQLRSSTALASDVAAYKTQIDQLDAMLAGSTTGITPSLQKFFSAMQTAAEDPANIPARQLVLAEAEGLARRFNTLYDRLYAQNDTINKQMGTVTDQINRLAGSVGSLNEAIAVAAANGKQPNDLLDQRDEAIRQLSEYIGVTVVPQDDSSFNLFIGTGQPLVVGSTVNRLEVVTGRGDPNRMEVDFVSGNSRQAVTTQLTGGELGGLIRYREEVLDSSLNALGRMALVINEEVNQQLGQGLDLKGNVGTALFNDMNTAQLMGLRVQPFSTNTSNVSGALRITEASYLTASDYRLEVTSTGYSARRLSDGAAITVSPLLNADGTPALDADGNQMLRFTDAAGRDQGFALSLSGTAAVGERFLLQPTRRGAADIRSVLDQPDQLAFAAPVRAEANLQNLGNAAITQPNLIAGPSPIDVNALQAAVPTGTSLTATVTGNSYTLSLPAGWNFANADGSPLLDSNGDPAAPTLTVGTSNTFRIQRDGYTFELTLSGRPANGDTYSLSFNTNGVSDNRNALKLVDLQSKQTVGVDPNVTGIATGSSFIDAYGDLVERVGTLTAQARLDSEATGAILKQATDNRDSLSAVNLDEEAANLIKFEQYYNASAQVIQVARSLFDTLLNTFR